MSKKLEQLDYETLLAILKEHGEMIMKETLAREIVVSSGNSPITDDPNVFTSEHVVGGNKTVTISIVKAQEE
jgi:16S rRNA C1402 N4-methylase RsmH